MWSMLIIFTHYKSCNGNDGRVNVSRLLLPDVHLRAQSDTLSLTSFMNL